MQNLTKKTFFAYALQMYNNPSCGGIEEFEEDLLRIKYTKRLLHRYNRNKEIPVRLVLNHIIGITNVFQPHSVARLLFFKIDPCAHSSLKTILEYLNLMPDEVFLIDGRTILNTDIPRDEFLWKLIKDTVEPNGTLI